MEKRQLEAERRKKIAEEELARKTASEQAAAAVLAEQQRKAKEDAARIHAEGMARYHAEQVAKDMAQKLKDEQAAKQKVADQRGLMGAQWKAWVEKQKTIKSEIIEKVKADKGIKTDLRPGMRLINRGLGQVVNTRDSIVRVVSSYTSSQRLGQQLTLLDKRYSCDNQPTTPDTSYRCIPCPLILLSSDRVLISALPIRQNPYQTSRV